MAMGCIQQYWILSTINRLFWPIIGYCAYLAVGPWEICEIVDNKQYGVVFVWGIYVDGVILPGAITYLYGFFQLMFCQLPLIWIYSTCVKNRYYEVVSIPRKRHRGSLCSLRKLSHAPFFVILSIEIALAIVFGFSYGAVAFLLAPFRTWSIILNAILWYMARNAPDNCFRWVENCLSPVKLRELIWIFFKQSIETGRRFPFGAPMEIVMMSEQHERLVAMTCRPLKSRFLDKVTWIHFAYMYMCGILIHMRRFLSSKKKN